MRCTTTDESMELSNFQCVVHKSILFKLDNECPDQLMAEGFEFGDSGQYIKQNKSGKIEDSEKGSNLERAFYRHEDLTHRCIWWHKPYRHWWLGHCKSLGENQGHAWLAPDSLCPHQGRV